MNPPAGAAPLHGFALAVLEVTVNREEQDEPTIALRDGAGRVLVTAADLARWRLRLPDAAPTTYQSERHYPLSAFNGLVATVDEQAQRLSIEAPPAMFAATRIDAMVPPVPVPQRSAVGGFQITPCLQRVPIPPRRGPGRSSLAHSAAGAAQPPPPWRRALQARPTQSASNRHGPMPCRIVFATVRAGDTVSRAGAWGNAVRYGGAQYATDFDPAQPRLTPGPFVAGQATVPSTIDVFVNNALVTQQAVKPGPFDITNISADHRSRQRDAGGP